VRAGRVRLALAATVAGCAIVIHATPALARGELSFVGCIGQVARGCADISPADGLNSARALAISPDGQSVYVASPGSDAVSAFVRRPDALLDFRGCVSQQPATNCAHVETSAAMFTAAGVAVGPTGQDVYVASFKSETISWLARQPDGSLAFRDCISQGVRDAPARPDCQALASADALRGATSVVATADGANVYVASAESNAVATFARRPDGSLSFVGCVGQSTVGCESTGGRDALRGVQSLALAADGTRVYAAGSDSNAVSSFVRRGDGSLAFASCVGQGAAGCAGTAGADALRHVTSVTATADGRNVYASGFNSGAVAILAVRGDGALAFDGCIGAGAAGCVGTGGADVLRQPTWVASSPDGRNVYATGFASRAVSTLWRRGDGGLELRGCVSQDGPGCANLGAIDALGGANAVAVSPDGANAYVVSASSQAVSTFRRAPAPAMRDRAPALSGLRVVPVAFAAARSGPAAARRAVGAALSYVDSAPALTTVSVQRAGPGRRRGRACARARGPVPRNRRCTRFVAVHGSFTHQDVQGLNRVRFSGRVGGRRLAPGGYRLVATARDAAGTIGRATYATFRVVR
jgi:DNA-binding beta-propeller fold protein YncE